MRRASSLGLVALTGCLVLTQHDGLWPCASDADCRDGRTCRTLGDYVSGGGRTVCAAPGDCLADEDCGYGNSCRSGTCACGGATTKCAGSCVDTSSDSANCGACGNGCPGVEQICQQGACTCATPGQTVCGNDCTDLQSDPSHCGRCSTPCAYGQICSSGTCACPNGQSPCNGSCADEQTDPDNCGACGVHCAAAGQTCAKGACACTSGRTVCGSSCVDEQTDANNCGGCGAPCPITGQVCQQGSCACPSGDAICGGACVDEQTDANNCGGCGVPCGGTCTGARCMTTIATGQAGAAGLAVDSTNVYWVNSTGAVNQMPARGGSPVALATGQSSPGFIAIDATNVYWTNTGGGQVMKVPIGGGTPTPLATGQSSPTNIAVGAEGVFWVAGSTTVYQVPVTGGSPTSVDSGGTVAGLAVDAQHVYFSSYSSFYKYEVLRDTPGGGSSSMLIDVSGVIDAMTVDASNLYFTQRASQAVAMVPLSGATAISLATDTTTQAHHAIATDSNCVYFTDASGDIVRATMTGAVAVLATGQGDSLGIGVDATSVYWTNPDAGTVMKLTPK